SGTYRVDIYCYDRSGVAYCLGTKEVVYEPNTEKPKAESINVAINNGKLEASAKHAYSTMNDYKMVFAVMNTNNPSRQNWSYGNSSGDGKYSTAIGLDYFENQSGTYRVDIYCYDRSGVAYYLGAKEVVYSNNDNGDKYNSNTSIMGKTEADVEKLVSVYTINSPIAFPQFYINQGIDLKSFASLYIEECEAEGVRGEVAFAQMLLETGYLSFTGDVRIEQYNFAGLGATGNGNPGNSLPDIRTGIRAQIQHLKCYASDQPLNNSCVDPRWGEWIRLKAPTVGQLSGTWAADKSYADKILTIMNQF
ncbi:glucosaminidase domain-containing protein, partial [Eubacterium callanderi]|uniref:glucosaminidase domain-containing protein n=1 Tax=Eubacterium callanderi TaxID=53442 RepID=UPI001D0837B5